MFVTIGELGSGEGGGSVNNGDLTPGQGGDGAGAGD